MDKSMTPYGMRRLQAAVLIGGLTLFGAKESPAQPPADAPKLADYFGFQPMEIYKLERRIGNLMIRDLDGDKTGDIIVGNNARSRIDLLLSSKRPAEEAESRPFRKETNDLEFDRRMRLVSIPVNKEVVSIGTGDFNGDGKPDLVYYGTPAEVEILFNEGPGRFGGSKKINTGDALEAPGGLAVGDLDQDGRDDIALLAENDLIFVYQTASGVLSEPERVPHTASNPRLLKLVDLDGNGALDLVILDGGTDHPIHVRFATDEKKLGPEQRFQVEAPRAIAFGQIDGRGGEEILTIENQSGRGRVLTLDESATDEQNKWGRLIFFGLPQGSDRGRSLAVGDLDGDKRKDVVVSDPANAQVWLYRQGGRSGLSAGQSFPGLLGGRIVHLADLDHDGKDEVYVLSEQEKQIGRSTMENGRITFPSPLPITGEPVAMDLGDLDGDKNPELVYIAKGKAAKRHRCVRFAGSEAGCLGHLQGVLLGPGGTRDHRRPERPARGRGDDRRQSRRLDGFPGLRRIWLADLADRQAGPAAESLHRQPWPDGGRDAGRSELDGPERPRPDRGPEHLRPAYSARFQGAMGNQDPVQFGSQLGRDPGRRGAGCRR